MGDYINYTAQQHNIMSNAGYVYQEEMSYATRIDVDFRNMLKFQEMYLDLLCRWKLEAYQEDETNYTKNFITPNEMRCISQYANKRFGTKYDVEFYLET